MAYARTGEFSVGPSVLVVPVLLALLLVALPRQGDATPTIQVRSIEGQPG